MAKFAEKGGKGGKRLIKRIEFYFDNSLVEKMVRQVFNFSCVD